MTFRVFPPPLRFRLFFASGLALLAALGAQAAPPRLLVVVVIDQMRADYLDRYAGDFRGGFKTLREEGAVLTARHAHVPTETGPGHAVILTGQFPARHGIVGNEWWDRQSGKRVYVVSDSVHGLGPENLLSYTLGDALKAKDPQARVVSLSLKDRSAILMGGKKADAVLWYDRKTGDFTTSSYYRRPVWLDRFNQRQKAKGLLAGTTDYAELIYTLKADRLLLELGLQALKEHGLGRDEHPDILALGFSGTDYIGHRHGPDSPEVREQFLSLDAVLARLLERLRASLGRDFDLVLASDHGVAPRPEDPGGRSLGAKRFAWEDFGHALEMALEWKIPAGGRWILGYGYPNLYLNRALAQKPGMDWSQFLRKAAKALKSAPGVAGVYIPEEIDPADPYADVYRRSIFPGRSGDLIVRVSTGVIVTDSRSRTPEAATQASAES